MNDISAKVNPQSIVEVPDRNENLDSSLRMLTDYLPNTSVVLTRIDFLFKDKQINFCLNSSLPGTSNLPSPKKACEGVLSVQVSKQELIKGLEEFLVKMKGME